MSTAFTNFSFLSSLLNATTPRTDPARWADWLNVKDYGATGNGIADDTAAIQTALNSFPTQPTNFTAGVPGGTIYFPAGSYKVSKTLFFQQQSSGAKGIVIRGDGVGSTIFGNFGPPTSTVTISIANPGVITWNNHGQANGSPVVLTNSGGALPAAFTAGQVYYIVNATTNTFQLSASVGGAAISTLGDTQSGTQTATNPAAGYILSSYNGAGNPNSAGPFCIENIQIGNSSTIAGSGAIAAVGIQDGTIRDCSILGFVGINLWGAAMEATVFPNTGITVQNCIFVPSQAGLTGTIGLQMGNGHVADNNDFSGWDNAIRMTSVGLAVRNGRMETNNVAIVVGRDDVNAHIGAASFTIEDVSMEANVTGILVSGGGNGVISTTQNSGSNNSIPNWGVPSATGFDLTGLSNSVIMATGGGGGQLSNACMVVPNNTPSLTFLSCNAQTPSGGGVAWSGGNSSTYIGCSNPVSPVAFANLPTSPYISQIMIINNCNSTTVGAVAAGGGSNTVPVQYWGTNWRILAQGV